MSTDAKLTLCYAPNTRASAVATLLEELGAPYELQVLNMKKGEQRQPAYLAINPMGKVPALRHGDAVITELVAIYLYLADLFPEKKLAPAFDDSSRGPYLRWMIFYAASFEPAMLDHALKREPAPRSQAGFGDYESVMSTLTSHLGKSEYMAGGRFTAADILWGTALGWMTQWKIVPETPEIMAYLQRVGGRPAAAKVKARDTELAKAQEAAAAG